MRPRCVARITGKREIENYIHWDAINRAYAQSGIGLGLAANFGEFDDVPTEVASRVHELSGSPVTWVDLTARKREEKASRAKRVLNGPASSMMTLEELENVDPAGEVRGWLASMKDLADQA